MSEPALSIVKAPGPDNPLVVAAHTAAAKARALLVTRDNKADAERMFLQLGAMSKQLTALVDPFVKNAHRHWQEQINVRTSYLEPVERAAQYLRTECGRVQTMLDREARQKADEAAAKLRQDDERRALDHAAALELSGDVETAAAVLAEIEQAPAPVVVATKVETETEYRDNWKFQIVDASKLPPMYLMPDEKAIGASVRALKSRCAIPGVRVWNDRQPIGKASKSEVPS